MKNLLKKAFSILKKPPKIALIIAYILTALSITGSILILIIRPKGAFYEILSYAIYAISAITLAYTIYTIVIFASKWKAEIQNAINRNSFTRELFSNYGYRAMAFAVVSIGIGVLYGGFFVAMAIVNKSVWYSVLAGIHIIMSVSRGIVVFNRKSEENSIMHAKTHINCGILLIVSTLALDIAVLQMAFLDRAFSYGEYTIYVVALYAFYKIITSIINYFKRKRNEGLKIKTIRNINLADAMISILALQASLLSIFGTGDISQAFNLITGGVISALIATMGVSMIVMGIKEKQKIKTENK